LQAEPHACWLYERDTQQLRRWDDDRPVVMGRGKDRVEKLDTSYGDAAQTEYWRYTLVEMDGIRRDDPARAALHCIYTGNM
jgi:hypothetical protein